MHNGGSVFRQRLTNHVKRYQSILIVASLVVVPFLLFFFIVTTVHAEERLPLKYASPFSQNNVTFYDPCDGSNMDSGAECTAPTGDQITWIGDSYSVEAKSKIESALSGVDLGEENSDNQYSPNSYIQYGKHLDWVSNSNTSDTLGGPSGMEILEGIVKEDKLRPYLVMALGTNDFADEETTTAALEKIAELVGDDTKVILTTAYTENNGDYRGGNNAKKSFASKHDNFYVADWASAAKKEYYAEDPVHPSANDGYDEWVETIVNALPKNCDSGLLAGDNLPEKIWNWLYSWFKEKNISGVDTSAVISGIMGNFMTESGLNPFMVGGGGNSYYGLWMKYGPYGGNELVQKVNSAVGSNHFKFYGYWEDENTADKVLEENGVSQDEIDKALDTELEILSQDWENEFIPALSDWGVEDTPRGYADLFLVTIERAVGGDSPIEDSAVRSHYGGLYQAADTRRDRADYFFDKYSGKAGSNNPGSKPNSSSNTSSGDCLCQGGSDGSSADVSGGIDEEQAQKIADYYNDDSTPLGSGYLLNRKDNCVAFSGWFVANLTDLTGGDTSNPTSGDGKDVAKNLAAKYNLPNDTTPKPWSVFSSTTFHGDNHTGVVVGVEGDQIITIEAEWWSETTGSLARVKKDTIPSGSTTTYTHLDGHLDSAKISEIIGESISTGSSSGSSSSGGSSGSSGLSSNSASSSIKWDSDGWITEGMDGYTKEPAADLGTKYKGGKPNKILLHYTQGTTNGLAAYGSNEKSVAAHFTIDLRKKEVFQHYPLSKPSGAVIDSDDVRDVVQIEIVGYGFYDENPENPDQNTKCTILGTDYTDSDYCFAKFGSGEWDYLAKLLVGISKWGEENGTNIPLDTSVTWSGDVENLRLSPSEFDSTAGIVAHMHAPAQGNHGDTGNIWPFIKAALNGNTCIGGGGNGGDSNIEGAKNGNKQDDEIGRIWFSDDDTDSMKTMLENYGDLAYRTGQVYGVPWIAILVQARYEDGGQPPSQWCGKNNAWGIACPTGTPPGGGHNYSNLGEGFIGYGETIHNGVHDQALNITDPKEYLEKLGPTWVQGNPGGPGYHEIENMKKSIDKLMAFIETPEGQAVIAEFGASTPCDNCALPSDGNGDVLAAVKYILDLASKNGSEYTWGGGHTSDPSVFDAMLSGSPVNVDCTGFASLVMYKTYGQMTSFTSESIFNDPLYQEVPRSEVRPGDIFAYNIPSGHGGIVIEASNGVVTKIAETGGSEGRSGRNNNLGYSGADGFSVTNMNTQNGSFFRWKGESN